MQTPESHPTPAPSTSTMDSSSMMMNKNTSSSAKTFILGIVIILLIAVLVAGGVGTYRVYTGTARDSFSLTVAKILHLPIVRVNGKVITYSDYVTDLQALDTITKYDAQNGNQLGLNAFTEEQKSDQVLIRLASNVLLQEMANKYNVKVEDSDLTAMRKQIITGSSTSTSVTPPGTPQQPTFKTEEEASAELQKRYGWDYKTYEQRVIIPFILQNKISTKIAENPDTKEQLRQKAQSVLDQIKKGGNFEELAKQSSEHEVECNL
jgi:hypothetical protein